MTIEMAKTKKDHLRVSLSPPPLALRNSSSRLHVGTRHVHRRPRLSSAPSNSSSSTHVLQPLAKNPLGTWTNYCPRGKRTFGASGKSTLVLLTDHRWRACIASQDAPRWTVGRVCVNSCAISRGFKATVASQLPYQWACIYRRAVVGNVTWRGCIFSTLSCLSPPFNIGD